MTQGIRLPLVVIGGSAGAIGPLRQIVANLPPDLPAAVCVAIHMPDSSASALARVLAGAGRLRATFAESGAPVEAGALVVAPPGHHLLIDDGTFALSRGATENGSRPAIDPLFRSAAATGGSRVVSVLLSGTLDDGAAGTASVRRAGGVTIVQDPADAEFADMPEHAIETGLVTLVLPAAEIAAAVRDIVEAICQEQANNGHALGLLDPTDRGLMGAATDLPGTPSSYSCPACGGVLYGREDAQYLCRLGHRYSPGALAESQQEVVEDALWTALRSLEESASLAGRVRDRARARADREMEQRFEMRRSNAQARADRIRSLLVAGVGEPMPSDGDDISVSAGSPEPEVEVEARAGAARRRSS